MFKLIVVLLVIILFDFTSASALHSPDSPLAADQYLHNTWTTRDGLPQDTVYCMIRDPRGYMWLGTHDGLVRFDGRQFKTFGKGIICLKDNHFTSLTTRDGLSDNNVTALMPDDRGNLWVGTENGLNCLTDGKFCLYTVDNAEVALSVNSAVNISFCAGNSHFENCQVKVKAEVKENPRNFLCFLLEKWISGTFFSPQPKP